MPPSLPLEAIEQCLGLVPVPYLVPAFALFRYLYESTQSVQASKQQMRTLAENCAQLLIALDRQAKSLNLSDEHKKGPLEDLCMLLKEASEFVERHAKYSFFKALLMKDQRLADIADFNRRIMSLSATYQVTAIMAIRAGQERYERARVEDERELSAILKKIASNQSRHMRALDAKIGDQNQMRVVMLALQSRLAQERDVPQDEVHIFLKQSLDLLRNVSGRHDKPETWAVSPYDVEFCHRIGRGGFGEVFSGIWIQTPVALKVFQTDDGAVPSSDAMVREIKVWKDLTHPNVLQFLGANTLDNQPFIVMPLLKNGNALQYLRDHPDCDRLSMLQEIARGLSYLHSKDVVHGDLKALNVLISDSGMAILADFGLSRVRSELLSHSKASSVQSVVGSCYWMSPERYTGRSAKKPSDIYAFAMTLYEIFTGDLPLGQIPPNDLYHLVAEQKVRPARPLSEACPQLTDDVWLLAESCWEAEPSDRPIAASLCRTLTRLKKLMSSGATDASSTYRFSASERHTWARWSDARPQAQDLSTSSSRNTAVDRSNQQTMHWQQRISSETLPYPLSSDPRPQQAISPTQAPSFESEASLRTVAPTGRSPGPVPSGSSFGSRPTQPQEQLGPEPASPSTRVPAPSHSTSVNSSQSPKPTFRTWLTRDPSRLLQKRAVGEKGTKEKVSRELLPGRPQVLCGLFQGHTDQITSLAFSPDGYRLLSGSKDRAVRVWNSESGESVAEKLDSAVLCVAFSPDGTTVVAGTLENSIDLWNYETGARWSSNKRSSLASLLRSKDAAQVLSVAFSPSGRHVVVGSSDGTVKVWAVSTGAPVGQPLMGPGGGPVRAAVYSPHGKHIASCLGGGISVLDAQSGELVVAFAHPDDILALAYSPDGKYIVAGARDADAVVWSVATGAAVTRYIRHGGAVTAVAFSPDGQHIASGSTDMTVRIWDALTGEEAADHFQEGFPVAAVTFSPDGRFLAHSSNDAIIAREIAYY